MTETNRTIGMGIRNRKLAWNYCISAFLNFIISIALFAILSHLATATFAYVITYIGSIFYGSAIHLKNTFMLKITKSLYFRQLLIVALAGTVGILAIDSLSPKFGELLSGLIAIIISAFVNLFLGKIFLINP